MDPKAVAAFVAVGLASPVLGYLAHLLIALAKTRQAHQRLEAEPLCFQGSRFRRLLSPSGVQLMGAGRIARLEAARVLAVSDDGASTPFTTLEFAALDVAYVSTDAELAAAAADPRAGRLA